MPTALATTPWLAVTLAAIAGLAMFGYAIGALDFLGAVASFFLGLLIALLPEAGLDWLFLLVAFTGLAFVATRIGYARKKERQIAEGDSGERGAKNVIGNGAAAAFAALATQLEPVVPHVAAQLAFATAVAAVTADTLASELGSLARAARLSTPPFAVVPAGTNGAVSWPGQAAAAGGAIAIAALSVPLVGVPLRLAWVPALLGFAGCQIDSWLGAMFEGDGPRRPLTKQDVNFLASAIPAAAILLVATYPR